MCSLRLCNHQYADAAQVAAAAARHIAEVAQQAIAARGRFQLVLAGGTTPLAVYAQLVAMPDIEWARWHLFCGDERSGAADDPARNSLAIEQIVLAQQPSAAAQWYPIRTEIGIETAATEYAALIRSRLPFDLVLLGMGEDGHTASLFPQQPLPSGLVIPVYQAPKPPATRVSLTPAALVATHNLLIIITGASKAEALARWQQGADLPISRVAALHQQVTVFCDHAAASALN
ncbi:6-phosphogluconolactonase [Chromatium okenii]|uniref:6-phosphogluconolactonase n=1 Tax=Chromatium okenii TaxID=61644 RepID=A0A2S7XR06_9GAMM|nr:6-phosphogluconolactonase [Chromatium okenii]PQJ96184.1 6-phosphogluconolactonase [Chromatium okenii]